MSDAAAFDALHVATHGSAAYREAVAASLEDLPAWLVPFSIVDGALLARFARELRASAGHRVLDLACGSGGTSLWIAEQTRAFVAGVDFAPGAIAIAARTARARELEQATSFEVAEAARLPYPRASFDAAMSIDALMFVDAAAAAREIARVVKPGGRFVMTAAESLGEPLLPTLVRDYRPFFEAAGFRTVVHQSEVGHAARALAFYREIDDRASRLLDELGESARPLVDEARSGLERARSGDARVRDVFFVAERAP